MAVYALTIAGVSKVLQEGSVDIRETANGINVMNCAIKSLDGTYRPAIRAEVLLTEDGTRIFGGNIDAPSEQGIGRGANGSGAEILTTISVSDFNALADRRQVTEEIPAGTLKAALQVLEPYLTDYGVTLHASQATGPSLPALSYVSRKLTDVFDELSALTNYEWTWNIDYSKSLRMVEIGTAAAPFNVTDSNRMVEGDITVEPTTTDYANYIILLIGTGQREVTDTFTGDGVTTTFALDYTLVADRGYVTNGPNNETLGAGATWTYDPVTNAITRISAPANLNAISITYTAQFPLRLTADGGAAPADLVEKTYTNDAIFDRTVGQALADALLARDMATPKMVRYTTAQTAIHPGQVQTITSTKRNLSGDFLITDVQITTIAGHILRRHISAVSGGTIPASWRETIKQWSGTSSASAAAASVTIITSGGVGGTGTAGKVPLWSSTSLIGDSIMTQTAGLITVTGALTATTTITATTFSGSGASLTSIPETAIVDGAILARVGSTETISGAWTFTSTPIISNTEPALIFNETDQGTNLKPIRFDLQGGVLQVQTLNDAFSVLATIFTLSRAGALAVSSGITAGSGAVGIVDTTGKIPAISSTYFASLSGTSLTGVDLLASVNTHTAAGVHTWSSASATVNRILVENTTSGATAFSSFRLIAGSSGFFINCNSQGYTPSGADFASGTTLISTTAGGISIQASGGTVKVYGTSTLAATFSSTSVAIPLDLAVNTNKFTVAAASGNTVVAGTLGVTGVGTFTTHVMPSTNYTSSLGSTSTKFLQAHIAELVVETLVAQNTTATIGGRVIVAPTNILTADLAPAATLITVKYNNFVNGDRIRLEAEGKLEWMAVASAAGGSAGAYTYTVTRNLDGSGADQWYAGDAAVDTGTTGNGFIDIYSTAGVLSGTGPTIVGNVRTGTTYSNIAARWAIGNLDGLYGYSGSTYGAAFGDPSNAWIKIDTTNGIRIGHNTTTKIQLNASGTASFTGTITAPDITLGDSSSWSVYTAPDALKFTRVAGLGFGQANDVFALHTIPDASGNNYLMMNNLIYGNTTTDGNAVCAMQAQGWDKSGAGSSTAVATIQAVSNKTRSGVGLAAGTDVTITVPTINMGALIGNVAVAIAGSLATTGSGGAITASAGFASNSNAGLLMGSGAFGTGNVSGNIVQIGRNSSGSGAAGYLSLIDKAGTAYAIWVDAAGKLRIGAAPPQEDGTPSDTSGTVVGTQT